MLLIDHKRNNKKQCTAEQSVIYLNYLKVVHWCQEKSYIWNAY